MTLALRAAVAELVDLQADYAAWLDRRSSSLLVWRKWLLSVHDLPSSLWLPRGQRGEHLSNMDHLPGQDRRAPTGHDDKHEMTARERDLQRKVEQLQTQVFMLGTIAGIMLSLVGKLGWSHVEQAIYLGLADAAASVPPESEADWDRFMAFIRKQGQAVTVMRPNQAGKADQDTTPTGVVQRGRTNSSSRRNTGMT